MLKKGQITAFIIIGIFIFVLISAVAYFTSYKYNREESVPQSMQQIKLFTDECLRDTAEGAILLSGVQGGVIYLGEVIPNVDTFYSYSTYWYDAGQESAISTEFIEGEISRYVMEEIDSRCLKGYEEFHENIETGEKEVSTVISDGYVEITMDYPVTMYRGDTRTMISKFSTMIPVKMGQALSIAQQIVDKEKNDPNHIPLSELGNMEMAVVPYKYSDDVMIYSVIDEENQVKGLDFKFIFASRFGDESSGNRDPKLLNADNLLILQGSETEYQFAAFDADNDNLQFDIVGRFPMDKNGLMKFTPTENDVGEHIVTIVVEDGNGGRDSQTIKILVVGA
ncbi:MAG: hypothetical protein KKE20_03645 [Nanoarchaeota archaeon]|nr:hypothetical protein [Nanoarchaeota archaeon]